MNWKILESGFFIGLKYWTENLRCTNNGGMYLDLIQIKIKKSITVGIIDPTVLEFLRRDFPQKTNVSVFNKKLKNYVDWLALIKLSKEIR